METRNSKLIISNAGGTASGGSKTYKVSLPSAWVYELALGEDNRDIEIVFDGEKITVSPKLSLTDFMNSAKEKGHKLIKLNYYNNKDLCTVIAADYTAETVRFENFTDDPIHTAFGVKSNTTWQDYNDFLKDRCVPKTRMGLKHYLASIQVDEYNPLEIIRETKGKMAEDSQWIDLEEIQ